ncbi:zinc ribbon domain-containing protein [Paenibacillus sp. 481]|uniref:zinc ribbon domain-containing protein n=1 Tax=Paenibacillus sp. 481 TaxID=2835869 RepID=UPI001E55E40C|nr:zinc ribbon domain-containing protein [Paenibacillus sp. 481]UHA75017.1 zinc ribbon domain-containing protein [Paenibacillus sp. 481]
MNRWLQKIKDGASKASEKAQVVIEINRIETQISTRQKDIDHNIFNIGEIVYEAYKKENLVKAEADVSQLVEANLLLEREIRDLEWRQSLLKNEKRCECGEIAAWSSKFCPACGSKLPEPPPTALTKTTFTMEDTDNDFSSSTTIFDEQEVKDAEPKYVTLNKSNTPSSYNKFDEEDDEPVQPYQTRLGGNRIDVKSEPELSARCCPNCAAYSELDAKWCERCGTPFI